MVHREHLAGARIGLSVLLAALSVSQAFINPTFTPADLVRQSTTILLGAVQPGGTTARLSVSTEPIKGEGPESVTLSFDECTAGDRDRIVALLTGHGGEVLLFEGGEGGKDAYIHAGTTWLSAARTGVTWAVRGFDRRLSGVYAGDTEMLRRMVGYLLRTPGARVPVNVGTCWIPERYPLGVRSGPVTQLICLPLDPDGPPRVYVASPAGDRLFKPIPGREGFEDITRETGVTGGSLAMAVFDFDRDGSLDLVSWDGRSLKEYTVGPDGRLQARPGFPAGTTTECQGLSVCPVPAPGANRLLLSTSQGVLSLDVDGNNGRGPRRLPVLSADETPAACPALVFDADADGRWDILQPYPGGALLWRGAHGHERVERTGITCAPGAVSAVAADFDGDGDEDLAVADAAAVALWDNDGTGVFRQVTSGCGSLAYKAPGGATALLPTDLNHDGAADLGVCYPNSAFMYHFNRGFRCFGEEGDLRLTQVENAGPEPVGQITAVSADFNGDNSLDLVVAFSDGSVHAYYSELFEKPILRIRAAGNPGTACRVAVWQGEDFPVCVGTVAVGGGVPGPALVTLRESGPCTLRWQLPGNPVRSRRTEMAETPQRVDLDTAGGAP